MAARALAGWISGASEPGLKFAWLVSVRRSGKGEPASERGGGLDENEAIKMGFGGRKFFRKLMASLRSAR